MKEPPLPCGQQAGGMLSCSKLLLILPPEMKPSHRTSDRRRTVLSLRGQVEPRPSRDAVFLLPSANEAAGR